MCSTVLSGKLVLQLVYGDNNTELQLILRSGINISGSALHFHNRSLCDSLSTVTVPLKKYTSHQTWYILVSFLPVSDAEQIHVGEVRFVTADTTLDMLNPTPGELIACMPTFIWLHNAC